MPVVADLDEPTIRRLIFSSKSYGGQIEHVVRNVLDAAVRQSLLDVVPDIHYGCPLADKITAVIWDLIMEGVYRPGSGFQYPNLPYLSATEYGRKCIDAGELTAHDTDEYFNRLKSACPSIDDVTLLYTAEALTCFRTGNFLASAVMVGVAAENMLLRLGEAVSEALTTTERKVKFKKDTSNNLASTLHSHVLARLRAPATPLPDDLKSILTQHLDGIFDLIRRTRNEAGHPSGTRMERIEIHPLLMMFVVYCKTVYDLMEWLKTNQI